MPKVATRYRWYLPLFARAVESFDLGDAELVISTSHAVAKGVRAPAGALHLSYVFTPMRYVWDLETQYFPSGRFPWPLSWYVRRVCADMRAWDAATARRPDVVIGISDHVSARIARHWKRQAPVIYPPVDVARFQVRRPEVVGDYYLVAGALAPYKRADLAVEACRILGRRLIVVGSGENEASLRRLAGPEVEFRGWVSDGEMASLFAGARALLFPGEEDFGIVPVEAMASGCPVVALGRGGAVETVGRGASSDALMPLEMGGSTVVPGGVLFARESVEGLCEAIETLEATQFDPAALRETAEAFSAEHFERDFVDALSRAWQARGWDRAPQRAGVPR
jgi:glycosyltransferase involved in cell wall biosynthesis